MAPDVREDFGLQPELADGFTVPTRLFRRSGRSEFEVFNAEGIQRPGDGNFGFGIEESIGKLLPLCFRTREGVRVVDTSDSANGKADL